MLPGTWNLRKVTLIADLGVMLWESEMWDSNHTKRLAQGLLESKEGKEVGAKVKLEEKLISFEVHAPQKGGRP